MKLQTKLFIIFDALDELKDEPFHAKCEHYAVPIILNSKLQKCRVLVTTRLHKSHEIVLEPKLQKVYILSSVDGFDKENLFLYLKKYCKEADFDPEDLLDFINEKKVLLQKLCQFPLYISMLCEVWKEHWEKNSSDIQRLQNVSHLLEMMIDIQKEHYILKHYSKKIDISKNEKDLNIIKQNFTEYRACKTRKLET